MATRTTSQAPQHDWADPLPAFAANIRGNPSWAGGLIGFALVGTPGSVCPQTKYSQAELNDKSPSGAPWVSTLVYQSVANPGSYYLAFEDSPTCATSWKGCGTGISDGDFNDAVFQVSGLSCPGGGQPCTVPSTMGACAAGVTVCAPGGDVACRVVVAPAPETCDGVDNDCNGQIDDGDLCGSSSMICDRGSASRRAARGWRARRG